MRSRSLPTDQKIQQNIGIRFHWLEVSNREREANFIVGSPILKYITPLLWSLLAVIALTEFSASRATEEIALDPLAFSNADMTVLK